MANGFQINEEDSVSMRNRPKNKKSGISGMLINWGLAKNEGQASMYLLGLVILCIALIVYQNWDLI